MYKDIKFLRQEAVNHYIHNSRSLEQTAKKFGLHYQTVYKWVERYRSEGMDCFLPTYHAPWNRIDKNQEAHLVRLKETYPGITLKLARQMLAQDNIKISVKGIMSVWKRYGYAGYNKKRYCNEFIEYVSWGKEVENKFQQAKDLYDKGDIKNSAAILNSISVLPKNDLMTKIPNHMLNLRRRIEKIYTLFGKIPLPEYLASVRRLYQECRQRHLHYSALRIGLAEVVTLGWSGRISEQLKKIAALRKIFRISPTIQPEKRTGLLFEPYFTLLIGEGMAYAHKLDVKKANKIANHCARLLRTHRTISADFMIDLGTLYSNLEEYTKAEYWFNRAIHKVDEEKRRKLKLYLAYQIGFAKCDLPRGYALLRDSAAIDWVHNLWRLRLRSLFSLIQGNPSKSVNLAAECLAISKKSELHRDIFNTFFTIASAYSSLGEERKARLMLLRLIPHLSKHKLIKQITVVRLLLKDNFKISKGIRLLPSIKLLQLLTKSKYSESLQYAKKRGILGYFYRFMFFFPNLIYKAIEQGVSLGIPKSIIRLPIFNKRFHVYDIKFIGKTIVCRNRKYLKNKLLPKEVAFLVALALKAGEPDRKILLKELYSNFWQRSANPARNLSHLLVRVKKALKIPSHLVEISRRSGEPVLINRGIHFITDYGEFEQSLATAHAFERADEWEFARKEYIHAFQLFRGAPFEKMYDPWSEQMRRVIMNKLENEAIHFAKACMEHDNEIRHPPHSMADAKKVLEKVLRIRPDSDEIKNILDGKVRLTETG